MKYLLDTHVWLWSLAAPEKLHRRARQIVAKASSELYLSPISLWETFHLHHRKRVNLRNDFNVWLAGALSASALCEAPINFAVASQAARIHLPQPDVGDTFLAASSLVFDLTLVTADEQLLGCKWLKTLSAI